jgi:hypothetical protein
VKRLCLFLTVGVVLVLLCTSVALAQDYTGDGASSASATANATASSTSTASSTATAGRLPETGPRRLKKTGGLPLTGPFVLAAVATAATGVAATRALLRRYTSS